MLLAHAKLARQTQPSVRLPTIAPLDVALRDATPVGGGDRCQQPSPTGGCRARHRPWARYDPAAGVLGDQSGGRAARSARQDLA